MFFARNILALKESSEGSHTEELQVLAYAENVGAATYGPYYFGLWERGSKKAGEERWLILRITEKDLEPDSWKMADDTGLYHRGGSAHELVALASLILRQRLRLGQLVRWNDKPIMLSAGKGLRAPQLIGGVRSLSKLEEGLTLAENLSPAHHETYILATMLYNQALELIESNAELAYLNLISAVEVLAQHHPVETPSLDSLDSRLAGLLDTVQQGPLRKQLEEAILKRERFIRRRFVNFILDHIEQVFWDEAERPEHGKVLPTELPELLDRIYDQRSRTLHSGQPFPPNSLGPVALWSEIDRSYGFSVGERKWEPDEFIPQIQFFERLVNHVLVVFLRRNQSDSS
jgi:hypothetical protein